MTDIFDAMMNAFDRMQEPEPTVAIGGVDMPQKTDPYDWTTPSGRMPTVLPLGVFEAGTKEGFDMRWYVVSRPLPRSL